MPGGDATGPAGYGPRTGWGAGYCGDRAMPGPVNRGTGRGLGMGLRFLRNVRRGHGWRNRLYSTCLPGCWRAARGYPSRDRGIHGRPYAPVTSERYLRDLQRQAEFLKGRLNAIEEEIEELSGRKGKEA